MPSIHRLQSIRKKLTKVAGSENLESLASKPSPAADGLESLSEPAPSVRTLGTTLEAIKPMEAALRKVKNGDFADVSDDEMMRLEAIVERDGRPVAFIVGSTFETLPDPWTRFNSGDIRTRINHAIPSIGRVERLSPSGRRTDHIGTGFIVGRRSMMTNRHVAEVFVRGAGSEPLRFTQGGALDFGRERGFDPTDLSGTLRITGVKMVHPFWDMALLELADLPSTIEPLKLSALAPEEILDREIATIGYPGRGKDTRPEALELEERHFQNIFGVKRIAPGDIDGREMTTSFAHPVSAMTHDSSTLAGNSGSAVVDVTTGEVVGLHFKGITLQANYSVPMYELARDQRVIDAGVAFTANVPTTREWESWWKQAAENETLVKPRPVVVPGVSLAKSSRAPVPSLRAGGIEPDGVSTWTVPITISISLGGAMVAAAPVEGTAEESFQIPIVYDGLDTREGYKADFLNLPGGAQVPMPVLTAKGEKAVARQSNGDAELKYHHFSLVMHKKRRLALFTAAILDWRKKSHEVDGRKPNRAELTGIPDGVLEQWVTDDRISEDEQLPDVFFTRDNKAFDKGHLVRRDDVAWGRSFEDIQMGNGDTYFTTNCSPQVKGFNQAVHGDFNWGDLENMIQRETKAEKAIVFAGPVLSKQDRFFLGLTERGPVKLQIPQHFWKIIVANTDNGVKAFGFLPKQDLSRVTLEEEFAVPVDWKDYQVSMREIEDKLLDLVSLTWCKQRDAYED